MMNEAAKGVVRDLPDVMLGYGVSDEYRYVTDPKARMLSRGLG